MSYIGTTKIGKMFLGETEIAKAYFGNDLVFNSGESPTPPTPSYDSKVEYLSNSDLTAYIDSGVAENTSELRMEIDLSHVTRSVGYVAGATYSPNISLFQISAGGSASSPWIRFGLGSERIEVSGLDYLGDARHIYKLHRDQMKGLIDSAEVATFTQNSITHEYPIHIFGYNNRGTHANPSATFRIYGVKFFSSSTLIKDLVPVRVGQVGAMFDTVSGTILYNAGEGEFGFGQDVE